jgi:UDP-glucose 4-epimerase
VSVLDDLSTGSMENIAHLRNHPDFTFVLASALDRPTLDELVANCDLIFHLAAAVGVRLIVENPVQTMAINVHGTEAVLASAARNRTPVFVASTSEVYGKSRALPFREDADLLLGATTKARWSYAASKALDEFLAMAYWNHSGVPCTVVRFFNTVGPRQTGRYGMVLPTFVRQALANLPITVYGTGEQQRCFGYVGDVVDILVRLARTSGVAGEVLNIGNDREISINELAELVKSATGSSSVIKHIPYEDAYGPGFEDMFRRVPCLEKLERLTGCRPRTSIESIVDLVVEHERGLSSKWPAPAPASRARAAAATEIWS